MEITTRRIGKCKILDCSGPITLGHTSLTLHKAVSEALQDDTIKVVINLKDVPYVDSSGLSEMISSYRYVKNQGGNLVFLNISKKIRTMIARLKLVAIFEICDDEQKALEDCE